MPGWENGSTRAWRKLRLKILRRDGYRCQIRLPGICTVIADCVHHLDGKALGDDPGRLVAACTPCNLKIGNPGAHGDPEPRVRTAW